MSNSSMNLWSETLALAAANRWYSSNIEDKHHFCNFLRHPTTQPVRCYVKRNVEKFQAECEMQAKVENKSPIKTFTLPLLQWIRIGWFRASAADNQTMFSRREKSHKEFNLELLIRCDLTKHNFESLSNFVFRNVDKGFLYKYFKLSIKSYWKNHRFWQGWAVQSLDFM